MNALENYYLQQSEPNRSCLLALRDFILTQSKDISSSWKYGMPFFCINGKMFCYLWVHKKYKQPYIGIVEGLKIEHPLLLQEKRNRMKILLIDPEKDIPLKILKPLFKEVLNLYL
jgi:hypothetical protein